jgi:hypothetical protein
MAADDALRDRLHRACDAALALGGDPDALAQLDPEDAQLLLGAAVRLHGARADAGLPGAAFAPDRPELVPTATDVVVTATAMLKASQIELFELGMWQTWGGGEG